MILIQTVDTVANEEQSALGSRNHSERCLSIEKPEEREPWHEGQKSEGFPADGTARFR